MEGGKKLETTDVKFFFRKMLRISHGRRETGVLRSADVARSLIETIMKWGQRKCKEHINKRSEIELTLCGKILGKRARKTKRCNACGELEKWQ